MTEVFNHGHAVIVGTGGDLPMTVHDARGLASLLLDPTRSAYPAAQVQLLTGQHARRGDVLTALDWLASRTRADPEATAIVSYSGHGTEVGGHHILPFGWDLEDLANTAIASAEFTERLRAIEAQKLLVLLDCCYAGGMAEAKKPPSLRSALPLGLFDTLGAGRGRVVIASSRKDEVSFPGHPYSVFTGALLEALAGYGAFEWDGYARVLDTALWLGRKVPERTHDRQHPIIKVSNLEDNFAMAYYAAGAKRPRKLDWHAHLPAITLRPGETQNIVLRRMLRSRRDNLLLIEERMSEYVEATTVPLQLIKSKRSTEAEISRLERGLGFHAEGFEL